MSTGAKLDTAALGGLGGIKERIQALSAGIKAENAKADQLEKDKESEHRNYCKLIGKQQHLKEAILTKEDEIEKTERKIKEIEERLRQKEEFVKESHIFTKSLSRIVPNEGDTDCKQKELGQHRTVYNEAHHRYMQAKEQKMDLEQRCEIIETKGRDVQRKVDNLKQELENNLMEEGRRGEQCKQSMDLCFRQERNIIGVEKMMEDMTKRKDEANKKVSSLRERITKAEDELEETSYERRVIEATIRQVLGKK